MRLPTKFTNSTASAGKGFRGAVRGSRWKSLRLDCPGRAPAGMSVRRQAGTVEQLPLAIGEANFRAPGSSEYADRQHGEFREVRTSPIHLRRHSRSGSGMASRRGGLASSRNPHGYAAVCRTASSPKFWEYSDDRKDSNASSSGASLDASSGADDAGSWKRGSGCYIGPGRRIANDNGLSPGRPV